MPPEDMPPEDITAEQMVARLLYRDGLMLVIDKPAALPCIADPKAAKAWKIVSARCASGYHVRRLWRIGSIATPPAA
jgi:23S rRNA-/tRNA-specific pseudouridylate synthase